MAEKTGYRASTKYLIASPTKTRAVARVVKGESCSEAMAVLENMPQKGARLIRATMKSAIASALNANNKLDEDMLIVKEVRVDEGPRLKRVWFRARDRADMLLKRMSHITVVVAEKAGE
ncbi:MAG TPA: 50S ribosomal protein L22 [Treponemataceae bacterium]|nr:50S ribosomal protein L22 [Treponemataceae bacterium]